MSEEEKLNQPLPSPDAGEPAPEGDCAPPAEYASPLKRIWAWVGVVYMAVITLLVTYGMANGRYLTGIGGLMVLPALGGLAASALWLWRGQPQRRTPVRGALLALVLLLCAALAVLGTADGMAGLLANFGG